MAAKDSWKTVGDFVSLQRGRTYKGKLVGFPGSALLGLGAIREGGGFRVDKFKTYGGECPPDITVQPGELFVALKGATKDGSMVGSVARCPPEVPLGRLTQDTVKLQFLRSEPMEVPHLYWVLRTPQYRRYCDNHVTGSAQAALSRRDFLSYPVPPIDNTRQRLVDLLELLDDKIELNRKINQTLEALAQALFQSWFIDFDGVPPEDLVESELGPIPRAWKVRELSALAALETVSVKPQDEPESQWEHFSIPAFDDGRVPRSDSGESIKSGKYRVPPDSVLVSKLNPRFPRIWMPWVSPGGRSICSTEFMPFRPTGCGRAFLFDFFWSRTAQQAIRSRVTGTTGSRQRVKPREIAEMKVLVPPSQKLDEYETVASPVHRRRQSNTNESRTLSDLRDTLLPKLISGEVRVPEAEDAVEADL